MSELLHICGELYPPPNPSRQRRYIWTAIHKGCGGSIQCGVEWSWKGGMLKQDGTDGCAKCLAQPLTDPDIYWDYV